MSGEEKAWYTVDADWNNLDQASYLLLKLGETPEWGDLIEEVCANTHCTSEEIWDGMAKALRDYLEGLE